MLVLLHVIIALSSLIYATYLLVKPFAAGFKIAYGLTGMTLLSGTYLVWLMPAHMMSACTSGLLYLATVSIMILVARRRLATANITPKR